MVWIPPQTTILGSDEHYPEEGPAREVTVDGFWIQTHQVTNAEFAEFVAATGYVTVAERPLDPADYPGRPAGEPAAGLDGVHRTPGRWTCGTSASGGHGHPARAGTIRVGRDRRSKAGSNHPVVHIAFEDAAGIRRLGGARSAHRGRMGGRRARRP